VYGYVSYNLVCFPNVSSKTKVILRFISKHECRGVLKKDFKIGTWNWVNICTGTVYFTYTSAVNDNYVETSDWKLK